MWFYCCCWLGYAFWDFVRPKIDVQLFFVLLNLFDFLVQFFNFFGNHLIVSWLTLFTFLSLFSSDTSFMILFSVWIGVFLVAVNVVFLLQFLYLWLLIFDGLICVLESTFIIGSAVWCWVSYLSILCRLVPWDFFFDKICFGMLRHSWSICICWLFFLLESCLYQIQFIQVHEIFFSDCPLYREPFRIL